MKIFSFFIIASMLLLTTSCSEDFVETTGEDTELDLRKRPGGDKPPNGFTNGHEIRYQLGEWTSTGCVDFTNFTKVFRTKSDCLCYKQFMTTTYSGANGYCLDLQNNCSPTPREPNSTCTQ